MVAQAAVICTTSTTMSTGSRRELETMSWRSESRAPMTAYAICLGSAPTSAAANTVPKGRLETAKIPFETPKGTGASRKMTANENPRALKASTMVASIGVLTRLAYTLRRASNRVVAIKNAVLHVATATIRANPMRNP